MLEHPAARRFRNQKFDVRLVSSPDPQTNRKVGITGLRRCHTNPCDPLAMRSQLFVVQSDHREPKNSTPVYLGVNKGCNQEERVTQ